MHHHCGMEQQQLVGLITRRSQVRVLFPRPLPTSAIAGRVFYGIVDGLRGGRDEGSRQSALVVEPSLRLGRLYHPAILHRVQGNALGHTPKTQHRQS